MMWIPHGPFSVGVVDVEWEASPACSADDMEPGKHLSGRLFYPTPHQSPRPWSTGVPWLPHYNYARGLGAFFFFRRPLSALMLLARLVMQSVVILLGWLQRLWLLPGAPMAPAPDLAGRPVVVFSHGLGGFRSMYTVPCAELASQGYVVLAVEHTDGSSAAAKPAGTKKWLYYAGLGGEAGQVDKTRTRVAEMKAALQVLVALGSGAALEGRLHLSPALPPSFLAGQLDMATVAAVGHSYGGATVAALVSQDPRFACGVALDPWWFAMPPESAANTAWQTSTPLLILGSNTWNVPNEEGIKPCGERRQQAVLQAAERGGGALLLVIKGTSHNTFADPLPLFSRHAGWVLNRLGLSADLEPEKGMALVNTAVLAFLSTHLPLGGGARHEQTWGPEAGLALLGKYVDDDADATPTQRVLSSLYPGKGILVALSDELLMRAIKHPVVVSKLSESVESKRARHDGGPAIEDSASELSGGGLANDVLTGGEVAGSALPSTKPGSAGLVNGTKHNHVLAPSNKGSRITLEEGRELLDLLGRPQVFLMEVHS